MVHHVDKLSSLPNCRNHIILRGDIEELLHKMDAIYLIYQHVDCLYTPLMYPLGRKFVAKSEHVFDNVQEAAYFNQGNRGQEKVLSIAKQKF